MEQIDGKEQVIPSKRYLLERIVDEVSPNPDNLPHLRKVLEKKYREHLQMLQHKRLREYRFIISERRLLDNEDMRNELVKEEYEIRQQKAQSNRSLVLGKLKSRIREGLSHWESTLSHKRLEYGEKLNSAESAIRQWNGKLSVVTERRSILLNQISQRIREDSNDKRVKSEAKREFLDRKRYEKILLTNSANSHHRSPRKLDSLSREESRDKIKDRWRTLFQAQLVSSIRKTIEKESRISEARTIKQTINERKKDKLRFKKEEALKQRKKELEERQNKCNEAWKLRYEQSIDRYKARSLPINKKLDNSSISQHLLRNRYSVALPQSRIFGVNLCKSHLEESKETIESRWKKIDYKPCYNRIIMDKLRGLSIVIKNRCK